MKAYDDQGNEITYEELQQHFAREFHYMACAQFMNVMRDNPTKTRLELEEEDKKKVDDLFVVRNWFEKNLNVKL